MRSKRISLFITCLLLLTIAGTAFAAQNLKVSKDVTGRNIIPRFAINPTNGDVYTVWTQQIPTTSNLRIWGRLIRRKANGSYAMKKATMLSSAAGFNANANVVYIPWKNEYLVVWDTFNFSQGLTPASILGRVVNKKGKAKKPSFTVLNDQRANNWAFLNAVPKAAIATSAETGEVYMTYTGLPTTTDDDDAGLRVVLLNDNYAATNDATLAIKSTLTAGSPSGVLPSNNPPVNQVDRLVFCSDASTLALGDGRFDVQINWNSQFTQNPTQPNESGLMWFFNEDNWEMLIKVLDGVTVDTSNFWVFAACTTNVEFTLTVTDTQVGEVKMYGTPLDGGPPDTQQIGSFSNPLGNAAPAIVDTAAFTTCPGPPEDGIAPAATTKFVQVLYNKADGVYFRNIAVKNNGKVKIIKKENKAFGHANNLAWMKSETYLDANTRLIMWQKSINIANQEIWLNIN